MHVEFLLMGLLGGGIVSGTGAGVYYYRRLKKQLTKQAYQINTIEQLYNEVQRASERIDRNSLESIEALVRALEARDCYTRGHSDRVNRVSMGIARELGLSEEELEVIHHGSLLHDIGKIGVYDRILLKPGPLDKDEFQVMKEHPQFGANILKSMSSLEKHIPIILYHHERQDGSGYPLGLREEEIPLGARIVQVADTWDAMASDRPYRRRLPRAVAVKEIRSQAGRQLDPRCVEAFLDWLNPPHPLQGVRGNSNFLIAANHEGMKVSEEFKGKSSLTTHLCLPFRYLP